MAKGNRDLNRHGFLALALGVSIALWVPGCGGSDAGGEKGTSRSFGLLSDAQYCDRAPAGSRFYRSSKSKLGACVEDLNRQDLAFTIRLGDLIDAHSACLYARPEGSPERALAEAKLEELKAPTSAVTTTRASTR